MMKLFPRALPGRRQKTELNSLLRVFLPVRGIAIFAVVAAHAAIGLIAAELNLNPDPTVTPLIGGYWQMAAPGKFIILELARCAVPLFLFLAGYHLVRSPRTWKAIRNNSRKLLLPMLFWSVIAWAVSWRSGAGGWGIGEFVLLLLSGRAQLGYFFIILIVQYFLLSRWLTPAMEKKPGLVLGGAVLLQLAVHAYDYAYLLGALEFAGTPDWITGLGPFPEFLFPRFIASFAFGVWASLNLERFKRVTEKRFVSLTLVAILLAVLVVLETGLIFGVVHEHLHRSLFVAASQAWGEWKISTALWTFVALVFIIAASQRRVFFRKQLETFGKNSYQVLLLHGMVLSTLTWVGYHYGQSIYWFGPLGFLVRLLAGLFVPLGIINFVRRWAPRKLQMLLLGS